MSYNPSLSQKQLTAIQLSTFLLLIPDLLKLLEYLGEKKKKHIKFV